jgi:hypothetical protein
VGCVHIGYGVAAKNEGCDGFVSEPSLQFGAHSSRLRHCSAGVSELSDHYSSSFDDTSSCTVGALGLFHGDRRKTDSAIPPLGFQRSTIKCAHRQYSFERMVFSADDVYR